VKLNDLPALEVGAHRDSAAVGFDSRQISDQKVAPPVLDLVRAHHEADGQGKPKQLLVRRRKRLEEFLEDRQRFAPVQFCDERLADCRDKERITDRTASLGNDGLHLEIAVQAHPDQTFPVNILVREEKVLLRCFATRSEPTDGGIAG